MPSVYLSVSNFAYNYTERIFMKTFRASDFRSRSRGFDSRT